LIEDNRDMRENTAEILELANYEVLTADNGKDGVSLAKSNLPDLIICDIMMPELDGYQVLYMLSKDPNTSTIPFIFLTAKADKKDMRKGMNLGADDYLTKPFEEMELLDAIESRLKKKKVIDLEFEHTIESLNNFMDKARGLIELEELSKNRKIKSYKKKQIIYREDEYPNALYFISKGKVVESKMDQNAKELITELYNEGDFLGYLPLLQESQYKETATAVEDCELAVIPRDDFLQLVKNNRDVSAKFIKMLSRNILDKEERLLRLAYGSVRERVAGALLQLHLRYNDPEKEVFTISFSREDLAGIVGTATESLIRTLSDFKEEKLIESKGREIRLINIPKLKKIAGQV
jgi:CRP-like cAMP-binding protein/FixJ family two-component response regulator